MSQKDYIRLAAALKQAAGNIVFSEGYAAHRGAAQQAWKESVLCVANALEEDNPKFKRWVFLEACGA